MVQFCAPRFGGISVYPVSAAPRQHDTADECTIRIGHRACRIDAHALLTGGVPSPRPGPFNNFGRSNVQFRNKADSGPRKVKRSQGRSPGRRGTAFPLTPSGDGVEDFSSKMADSSLGSETSTGGFSRAGERELAPFPTLVFPVSSSTLPNKSRMWCAILETGWWAHMAMVSGPFAFWGATPSSDARSCRLQRAHAAFPLSSGLTQPPPYLLYCPWRRSRLGIARQGYDDVRC